MTTDSKTRRDVTAGLAACLLLPACGGGSSSGGSTGGSGGGETPTPTPTPTPPVPTPPKQNANIVTLTIDETFTTAGGSLQYSSGVRSTIARSLAPAVAKLFDYVAATQTFDYRLEGSTFIGDRTFSFTPANISATDSTPARTVYSTSGFREQYSLTLVVPGPGTGAISPLHVTIARYRYNSTTIIGGPINLDQRPFAYGQITAASGVPASGSGTYTGLLIGTATGTDSEFGPLTNQYDVTGTVRLTIDFVTATLTGTVTLTGTYGFPAMTVALGTFSFTQGTLTRSAATLSGTIAGGEFAGFLAGGAGEELGGGLRFTLPDPLLAGRVLTFVGAAVAKR